jgi:peptidoglycan/xylan/chitin deacetylase (PgdA/CDA1 family)
MHQIFRSVIKPALLICLCYLIFMRIICPYAVIFAIGIIYWIPRILISYLNRVYPQILTHNPLSKNIALTFDDVPYNGTDNLEKICDILEKNNMRGTFFIMSDNVNDAVTKKLIDIVKRGHQLGNHGRKDIMHYLLDDIELFNEIVMCDDIIKCIYRQADIPLPKIMLYRPGCGLFNDQMIKIAEGLGYKLALGSVYPNDPLVRIPIINYYYLKWHIINGDIVILHDRDWTISPKFMQWKFSQSNVSPEYISMLEMLMYDLQSNNLKSVTVDNLFNL